MLMAVRSKSVLKWSLWKRLFLPIETSKRLRGAMRGGLWSSFSVPGAGNLDQFGGVSRRRRNCVKPAVESGRNAVAGNAGFELLVGGEAAQVDPGGRWHGDRRCAELLGSYA